MAAILHVGDSEGAGADLIRTLAADGIDVVEAPAGDHITPDVRERRLDAALLTGPDANVPTARRVHEVLPDVHIVFLIDAAQDKDLRRDLLLAPRIGRYWSVIHPTPSSTALEGVRSAVEDTVRRRQLRTTLHTMNVRLQSGIEAAPRRPIVSDRFLAAIFDRMDDAVVILDEGGRVLAVNEAAKRLWGAALEPGTRFQSVIGSDAPALPDGALPHERSAVEIVRGGTVVHLEISATEVRDDRGRFMGTAMVARDTTERVVQERRREILAEAAAAAGGTLDADLALRNLATLIASRLADVCLVDTFEGDLVMRRAAAARHPEDELLVQALRLFAPSPEAGHPFFDAVQSRQAILRNGLDAEGLKALTHDETHRSVIVQLGVHSLMTLPLSSGDEVIGAMTLARSRIPEHFSHRDTELLEELARVAATAIQNAWLYHAAQAASRAKDEFLATVSHELRTPMTSILGWAQILRVGEQDERSLRDGLEAIERSARVQAQLIDDLLDLSRIQMGKLQLQLVETSIDGIVRGALETITPAAGVKRIQLLVDIADDIPEVRVDPNRLQQVIWNLLSNSVKFTDRGGVITVVARQEGSSVMICVRDTGVGIERDFLPHVFDRFRQADLATTRRFGGLGLGLSIVKQIVELHGGRVEAESPGVGRGSTFTVYLPVAAASVVNHSPEEKRGGKPLRSLEDIDILVVDDDPGAGEVISTILSSAGASTRLAASASAALEALRRSMPDVLISDIAMPDEDGFSLIERVRNTLHISDDRLPAIALTALGDLQTRVRVLGAGFQRHLRKPVEARALVDAVAELARPHER